MNDGLVSTLRSQLRGAVIARGDAEYDEARALYNGMIDKKPLAVARCADCLLYTSPSPRD